MCQIPELEYPLDWRFQIITEAGPETVTELISVLRRHGFIQTPKTGNTSKTGKYQTYILNVTFKDPESKAALTKDLTNVKCVKYLL